MISKITPIMARFNSFVFFALTTCTALTAQDIIKTAQNVQVLYDETGTAYLTHQVTKKQTIYGIGRLYHIQADELLSLNPDLAARSLKRNELLRIPLKGKICTLETDRAAFYKVEPGETLYSIARTKSAFDLKNLIARNHLNDHPIKAGQLLMIGYLCNPPDEQPVDSILEKATPLPKSAEPTIQVEKTTEFNIVRQGVAARSKIELGPGRFYALHRDVPKNQSIQIVNPITGRAVIAKVLGKIPRNYSPDVEVVVSSEVAKELFAAGKKFFVQVKYSK